MRVLLISANWPPIDCGIGDYTFKLAQALAAEGIEIGVVTRENPGASRPPGIAVFPVVKSWRGHGLIAGLKAIENFKPEIVHLQYEGYSFNQSFLLPAFWSRIRAPKVLTLHEVWFKNSVHRVRDSFLHRGADHLIVNDQGCLERFNRLGVGRPVTKIGVGMNVPESAWTPAASDSFNLVYFGFLNRIKTIDTLLEAIARSNRESKTRIKLTIIGPYEPARNREHSEIQKLHESLRLEESVQFTGRLPATEVSKRLAASDAAILPFIDGASPRRGSLQACLGIGLPTITSKSAYSEPDLVSGKNVLYLDSLSVPSMVQALSRLAGDSELRSTLSRGAFAFGQKYRWSRIADSHLTVYRGLLL